MANAEPLGAPADAARGSATWARRLYRYRFEAAAVTIALGCGGLLALATTRVAEWFVMTDELLYERLGISIAQTGSPLPRVHGVVISNVNQLYPLLLALPYGEGNTPQSLHDAHVLNAFVMASAVVPVFLLARMVTRRPVVSLVVATLAVAVPWVVLASFLLTEVVAYPAFCWAMLALSYAVAHKRTRGDILALAAIAVAVFARTQFVLLLVVLPGAVVLDALVTAAGPGVGVGERVRRGGRILLAQRKLLIGIYAVGLALVVGLAAVGRASALLGSYATTVRGFGLVDVGLFRLAAEHLAVLALSFLVLPFLVAVAWLLVGLRPSAEPMQRAFASVGITTLILLTLEVSSFDQRFGGGLVKDRYLFYVVPVLLVALGAQVTSTRRLPTWSVAVPTLVCAVGFGYGAFAAYEKLNVDSPAAIVNNEVLKIAGSVGWARILLPFATVVLASLYINVGALLRPRFVAIAIATITLFALPAQAIYAFQRLFAVSGTAGFPVTLQQGPVFNWIDRALGPGKDVTIVAYPARPEDYWAGAGYWWDAEFWNEDVQRAAVVGGAFTVTPTTFPVIDLRFDPKTGLVSSSPSDYAVMLPSDSRFGLDARLVVFDRGALLLQVKRPWRATWVSRGLYDDGWTRSGRPGAIRVFAYDGQETPVERRLTLTFAGPLGSPPRPVRIAVGNTLIEAATSAADTNVDLSICVPAHGVTDIRFSSPVSSTVYGDLATSVSASTTRRAGVLLKKVYLAGDATVVSSCGGD